MSRSTTLNAVAKLAGVSMGTASQALNNKPSVSPETRIRVLEAAESLGYNYDKDLHLGKTTISVVGMLVKHEAGRPIEPNLFYSHVQVGIDEECRERGLSMMFSYLEVDNHNRPILWPTMVREQQVDGLIIVGTYLPEDSNGIQELNVPIILVDGYAPKYPYDSIVIDNKGGAATLAHYLVSHRHTSFGIVGSTVDSFPSICERRDGFIETLHEYGIERCYVEESGLNRADSYAATQRLIEQQSNITAIFACNDEAAVAVIRAITDCGLRVPDDISVVGFDDISLSRDAHPALTTVQVPKRWLGTLSVQYLLNRARNPDQPKTTTTLGTQLIIRDSVRTM